MVGILDVVHAQVVPHLVDAALQAAEQHVALLACLVLHVRPYTEVQQTVVHQQLQQVVLRPERLQPLLQLLLHGCGHVGWPQGAIGTSTSCLDTWTLPT